MINDHHMLLGVRMIALCSCEVRVVVGVAGFMSMWSKVLVVVVESRRRVVSVSLL